MIRFLIQTSKKISQGFDAILPPSMRVYGTEYFDSVLMRKTVAMGQTIMDIGGGKNPNVDAALKTQKNLRIIGIDIDENELHSAPSGLYDRIIVGDICTGSGIEMDERADLIIARALMEHVPDTKGALQTMNKLLKPGGHAIIFVPCKNAWFTFINRALPEKIKLKLLRLCFPEMMHRLGFKAFYDAGTPAQMSANAKAAGFEIEELSIFYASGYFQVFFPLHIVWRLYQLGVKMLGARDLCETFTLVLRKPDH